MNRWLLTVSVLLAFAVTATEAASDAEAGKAKSAACIACHGPDGNSPANPLWPKLAGQHPGYIKKQLVAFRSGARMNQVMSPMAASLKDQDIEDLAAYYSGQAQSGGSTAADQVELGEKIFRAGNPVTKVAACMACHGPTGIGNAPANFPRISGQHAAYIVKSLQDYRSGNRDNDAGAMMQTIAAKMTDEEIAAVAQYIQGLH